MTRWFYLSSRVDKTGESKLTHRESLEQVAKTTGECLDKLLNLPKLANSLFYIIDYYFDIAGAGCFNHGEIKAWSDLRSVRLSDFEIDCIIRINQLANKNG